MSPFSLRLARTLGLLAGAAGALVAAAIASCSLIIETRSTQCQSDKDCAHFPHAGCDLKQGICVDLDCADGTCVCDPQTSQEILNGCPKGTCTPFDNGRVHGLVDGGLPPATDAGTPPQPVYSCGTGGGGTGGTAPTLPSCEDPSSPPLYILGPDSMTPLLQWVAKLFAKEGGSRVVFQSNSSCTAVAAMYDATQVLASGTATKISSWYYDATGTKVPCTIPDKDMSGIPKSVRPDISLSDVFAQTCGYDTAGTDQSVVDSPGPVQAMAFVVPRDPASKETSISAEAAYMIYGRGAEAAGIAPWTDTAYIYQRSKSSGTQQMIATTLGLDPTKFHGTTNNGSDAEAALIACSPQKDKTIGILAADYVQATDPTKLRLLAYQHYQQSCAYYPDSVEGANDKRNVRDGHYFIWGPIHMFTRTDAPNMAATRLINYVSGVVPPPADEPVDIFQVWADAHLVPQCAMHVTRTSDGGPLAKHLPAYPCYCKYDEVTNGASGCPTCKASADCPSDRPTCNFGFCEPAASTK